MSLVKVAICQMCANGTKEENLAKISRMTEEAAAKHAPDVIVFPEYCYYAPVDIQDSLKAAETLDGPYIAAMSALAKKLKVNIIPGSFVEKAGENKVYNVSVFIDRSGKIIGKYRKIHLMKAMGYDESSYVEYGQDIAVFDTDFGRVGLMVCYDLRFPELARTMVKEGANVVFVPADFPSGRPLPPRTDHWDLLTRATALLNTTYVVAANQFGILGKEAPFGRSSVVDPWGTVVAQAAGREEIVVAEMDMDHQKAVRDSLVVWQNRRPEIYRL